MVTLQITEILDASKDDNYTTIGVLVAFLMITLTALVYLYKQNLNKDKEFKELNDKYVLASTEHSKDLKDVAIEFVRGEGTLNKLLNKIDLNKEKADEIIRILQSK